MDDESDKKIPVIHVRIYLLPIEETTPSEHGQDTISAGYSPAYSNGWESVFGKKENDISQLN